MHRSLSPSSAAPLHSSLTPIACGVVLLCAAVQAQAQSNAPLALQASPWLQENLPSQATKAPTQLSANKIEGQVDKNVVATGSVEIRRPGTVMKGEQITYDVPTNTVTSQGYASVNQMGNTFGGEQLEMQLDVPSGTLHNADFTLLRSGGSGTAKRLDIIDDKRSTAQDAVYTTCGGIGVASEQQSCGTTPDWFIRGKQLMVDTELSQGYVRDGALVFKNVPIVPIPGGVRFPLGDQRMSGFLPPSVGYGSTNGLTYTQPYYFNLAPNRDATLVPTYMQKRGLELAGQFRYLESDYKGQLDAHYLPNDKLRDNEKRWYYHYVHNQTLPTTSYGTFGLNLDLQRVSDRWYWQDFNSFSSPVNTVNQRTLPSTATINWSKDNWSAFVTQQSWQTLQLPSSTIVPPYGKQPQVHVAYNRVNHNGFDYSLDLDSTHFVSDSSLTGYPNGTRSYAVGKISYPWRNDWGYITPSFQLNARHYETTTAMSDGRTSASVVLPTLTLDSGLVFERDTRFFGRAVTQTLEPRVFLAYTPYKDQSALPVYDSAVLDFNSASIFSANPFSGNDRVADAHAVTLGATSRFYDKQDGAELARFSVAARQQWRQQQVLLNTTDTLSNYSYNNILFEGQANWTPKWSSRAVFQWDPKAGHNNRSIVGVSYHPSPYRTISANYNMQRSPLTPAQQIDVGWQWPLNDLWGDKGQNLGPGRGQGSNRWYSVGRVYYSLQDKRLTNGIIGLEYDSCCYIGRVVLERRQTAMSPATYSNRIMFQLELKGLSRIGSSPLQTLRDNVPDYMQLRDKSITPSRFENYDHE